MKPENEGEAPHALPMAAAHAVEPRAPPRCFWALLSAGPEPSTSEAAPNALHFVYVDPDVQKQLGSVAPALVQRRFTDFVHTDERAHARDDLAQIVQSRTLFGSVTRCRYATISHIQQMLSSGQPMAASDGAFVSTDVVVNMVGERLALCFFHTITEPERPLSSICGTSLHAFDASQSQKLWYQLHAAHQGRLRPVRYVFQVLANAPQRTILFSWPPPQLEDSNVHSADYFAEDFARLVQGIHAGQAVRNMQSTSCTQRFRASHTLTSAGSLRGIASVLIPYGSVMLACFQVTSDRPNPSTASPEAPPEARRSELSEIAANGVPQASSHQPSREKDWKTETHATIPVDSANARSALLQPSDNDLDSSRGNVATLAAVAAAASQTKTCSSCGKSNSPEWRRGPSGHKTLCNACGLRYARSLSNKRKRGKDGTMVTVEATGNPNLVPPSRGSGGGSRPGVHRRSHKRSATHDEPVAPKAPSQDDRLVSVLASLPQSPPAEAAPYNAPPLDAATHPAVMAAAAAAADPQFGLPNTNLPELHHTPATTGMLPTPVPAPASTPNYLATPGTAPSATPNGAPSAASGATPGTAQGTTPGSAPGNAPSASKGDYDPKTLDAILSNTLLPASHEQTPIFTALTQPPHAPNAHLRKNDVAFSVPMDAMAVSANTAPTDAAVGLLPTPETSHFSDMFTGMSQATPSQQET